MSTKELIDKYDRKFISGNSVPINCTRLSKEDWEELKQAVKDSKDIEDITRYYVDNARKNTHLRNG